MNFNYMLIIGLSGMGKTTFVKNLLLNYHSQGYKLYVADPNYQYSDIEAVSVGSVDLYNALNHIAKPLLFKGEKGVLAIEDYGFTINQMKNALQKPLSTVKNSIKILLENARKYRLKIIIVAHRVQSDEIEPYMLPFFDTIVFFRTPITTYTKRILKYYGVDVDIGKLEPHKYIVFNTHTREMSNGVTKPLKSHEEIENSGDFQIKRLLGMAETKTQAVAILKIHLNLSDKEISNILNISVNQVRVYKTRLRKYGIPIRLENKNNIMEIMNLSL